jgi:hypothetical protein
MANKTFLVGLLFCLVALSVSAQTKTPEEKRCESPFYSVKEVSQKAIKEHIPLPETTEEFRQNYFKANQKVAHAKLSFVFCKTGEITDIQIIEGLSFGMDERLIESVRGIKFIPARKDGKAVCQKQIIVFSISFF